MKKNRCVGGAAGVTLIAVVVAASVLVAQKLDEPSAFEPRRELLTAPFDGGVGGVVSASRDEGRRRCTKNANCSAGRICSQDGRCERRPNRIPRPPAINSHCTPPQVWDPAVGFCVTPKPEPEQEQEEDPCQHLLDLLEEASNLVEAECPDMGPDKGHILGARVVLPPPCLDALHVLGEVTRSLALCRAG